VKWFKECDVNPFTIHNHACGAYSYGLITRFQTLIKLCREFVLWPQDHLCRPPQLQF